MQPGAQGFFQKFDAFDGAFSFGRELGAAEGLVRRPPPLTSVAALIAGFLLHHDRGVHRGHGRVDGALVVVRAGLGEGEAERGA